MLSAHVSVGVIVDGKRQTTAILGQGRSRLGDERRIFVVYCLDLDKAWRRMLAYFCRIGHLVLGGMTSSK
jgi:hypothetical protein